MDFQISDLRQYLLKIDSFSENDIKGDSGDFSVNPKIHPAYKFRNFFLKLPKLKKTRKSFIGCILGIYKKIRKHPNYDFRDFSRNTSETLVLD